MAEEATATAAQTTESGSSGGNDSPSASSQGAHASMTQELASMFGVVTPVGGNPNPEGQAKAPDGAGDPSKQGEQPGSPAEPGKEAPPDPSKPGQASGADKDEFPQDLAEFKDYITGKKWDPKDSKSLLGNALKSAVEVEKLAGRKATESSHLASRIKDLDVALLTGGLEAVNQIRERQGLPRIQGETRPLQERQQEFEQIQKWISNLTTDDTALEAFNNLRDWASKNAKSLEKEGLKAELLGNPDGKKAYQDYVTKSSEIYAGVIAQNPQASDLFENVLLPLTEKGGLLQSYGITPAQITASPERAAAWLEIAQALNMAKDFEGKVNAEVEKRVKATMEQKRKAGNAGIIAGGTNQAPAQTAAPAGVKAEWDFFKRN